jgi:uncharacterized C2H2 Zn-finger protein
MTTPPDDLRAAMNAPLSMWTIYDHPRDYPAYFVARRWEIGPPPLLPSETPFTCPRCGAVSHNPNDARERYCGRCHAFVGNDPRPRSDVLVASTLGELRTALADRGLVRLVRQDGDDACIVETWL